MSEEQAEEQAVHRLSRIKTINTCLHCGEEFAPSSSYGKYFELGLHGPNVTANLCRKCLYAEGPAIPSRYEVWLHIPGRPSQKFSCVVDATDWVLRYGDEKDVFEIHLVGKSFCIANDRRLVDVDSERRAENAEI